MPSTITPSAPPTQAPLPPLRRWRNDDPGERARAIAGADGLTEDERARKAIATPAAAEPAQPLVLVGGALVVYDGGPGGRAALARAVAEAADPIVVVHVWAPADPVRALGAGDHPAAAASLLRAVEVVNARTRERAKVVAGDGADQARRAGRHAQALALPAASAAAASELIASTARRLGVDRVITPDPGAGWWQRLTGRTALRRLNALAPCDVLVVPADGGAAR